MQDSDEQKACTESLLEVLSQWNPASVASVRFQLPTEQVEPTIEVMSSEIFALIAADAAPWQLELGR